MKPTGYSAFREHLLDKPSLTGLGHCAICGRLGTNKHHVIEKGAGGVTSAVDARIPLVELCSGCHDMVHMQRKLHIYWSDALGGWAFWVSRIGMDDQVAWTMHQREFRVMPGQVEQMRWGDVIGRRS